MAAAERTLVVTRSFDAPRKLMFRAWTDREELAQWFPPKEFTAPVVDVDPRPGGVFRTKVTVQQTAETVEDYEALGKLGSREGLGQSFEKLDELLARLQGRTR